MGVARFALQAASVNLEKVLADIRADQSTNEGEKRRRQLDIEIAISETIQALLQGGAAATAAQIQAKVQSDVIGKYNTFKQGGARGAWPFPR